MSVDDDLETDNEYANSCMLYFQEISRASAIEITYCKSGLSNEYGTGAILVV